MRPTSSIQPSLHTSRFQRASIKKPIEFLSQGHTIRGWFHRVEGEAATQTVLSLAGFLGTVDDVLELGQRMSRHGFNALTCNNRGAHQSEDTVGLQFTREDIQAAFDWLHQERVIREFRANTRYLVFGGYSFGGGMALVFAANHRELRRISSIAGTDLGEFARDYQRNPAFAEATRVQFEAWQAPTGPAHFERRELIQGLMKNPSPYDLDSSRPL